MKRSFVVLVAAAALASGCVSYSGRGLVSGQSDAKEVEALMGQPAERITLAGGDSVWFYPQNPNGLHTFAARLNPQGILQQVDQRLTVQNLAKLVPGQSTAAQVREILGPPWQVAHMARQQRDVWQYRMEDNVMVRHDLYVQFSADGLVREVLMLRDYVNDIGHDRD
ncbi:MAG: outer membrane protein assembly factor BamE domain-containing protein [Betaproteobacteria bacterium]